MSDSEQNIIQPGELEKLKEIQEKTATTSEATDAYQEVDVFAWANNLVQYVDELKIELFFFAKNQAVYKVKLAGDAARQLRPLFIDEILEYILCGIDKGLIVRTFEEAEKEENVLQKTRVKNVDKLVEVLGWLKTQRAYIEEFVDEEHDLKRIKGVIAYCSHKDMETPFYVIKSLPTTQILKGNTAWMYKDGQFKPFDTMSAIKVPAENQLLVVGDDLFVFNQAKLKSLFGYDAKAASIARQKVKEIEDNFKLSFAEGIGLQALVKGKPATIKKLQKIEPSLVKQDELIDHAEEMGVELMVDDEGSIIIMDDKDLTKFVNLLNDDYVESPMTGQRYEIIKKKPLKLPEEDEQLLT
jgi:predicted peroxiredoxin